MKCRYEKRGPGGEVRVVCGRPAAKGWTTCNAHHSAGSSVKNWKRTHKHIKEAA